MRYELINGSELAGFLLSEIGLTQPLILKTNSSAPTLIMLMERYQNPCAAAAVIKSAVIYSWPNHGLMMVDAHCLSRYAAGSPSSTANTRFIDFSLNYLSNSSIINGAGKGRAEHRAGTRVCLRF